MGIEQLRIFDGRKPVGERLQEPKAILQITANDAIEFLGIRPQAINSAIGKPPMVDAKYADTHALVYIAGSCKDLMLAVRSSGLMGKAARTHRLQSYSSFREGWCLVRLHPLDSTCSEDFESQVRALKLVGEKLAPFHVAAYSGLLLHHKAGISITDGKTARCEDPIIAAHWAGVRINSEGKLAAIPINKRKHENIVAVGFIPL